MIIVCPFPIHREFSQQADLASRLYRKFTPMAQETATDIWDVMTKIQDRMIKTIRLHNFEKYISIAHKTNGNEFFHEVHFLFS